jgi:hypothetical protein
MGLYTILYYPSNNEPLPSSHLTIRYLVALPNITSVTIATLTCLPQLLYRLSLPQCSCIITLRFVLIKVGV